MRRISPVANRGAKARHRSRSTGDPTWPGRAAPMAVLGLLAAVGGALVGAIPAGAAGSTWYVSQSGSGSSCTSVAPCASVAQALSLASAGDTIEVSGTIEGNIFPEKSITIEQMAGGSPAVLSGSGFGSTVLSEGATITLKQITITGGDSALGGGIDNDGGSITIIDSTISGNSASGPGGSGIGGSGGGIFNEGTLVIDDSTISGNTALGSTGGGPFPMGGTGGGISNDGNQLTIDDSTISGNTVTPGSGGGPGSNGRGAGIDGSATLAGDILATSGGAPSGGECDRSVTDDGYNVDDDGTCGLTGTGSVSDSPHIDGYLGTLANHGGPTATVALSAGADNPAQAAIPDTFTAPGQSTPSCGQPDQRGVGRGAPCDMGAYALTVPAITSLDSTTFTVGAGGSFQVTESGVPGPTFTEVGSLPAGVSLSPAGLLSGIPAGGSGGTYPITVTASNGVSAPASQAFTLTIDRAPASAAPGYLLAGSDGGVFAFDSTFFGSMGGVHLDAPIVGVKRTPDGDGYWLVGADGGVFAFGDAAYHGSLVGTQLTAPIVGMATTADGRGYWLVGADGGVFAFGDAAFHGSMAGMMLSAPIVGMKRTSDGGGYWLVGADGGVFAFGDAAFYGSMVGTHLTAPIVGMATTGDGKGYWLAGADGGVFAFGGAPFDGSMGGTRLSAPIVGIGEEPPAQIG